MIKRRWYLAAGAAVVMLATALGPVPAGAELPALVIAPAVIHVGDVVTISSGPDGACGAEEGDTPAIANLDIGPPEGNVGTSVDVPLNEDGSWSYQFTGTVVVGQYFVNAFCGDLAPTIPPGPATNANDFGYASSGFDVVAAEPPPTPNPPTTLLPAAPAPAPARVDPAFTG